MILLGGPGAIDWYQGMQPLIRHAEIKGSKRVKLHRQLAQLLEAKLKVWGTTVIPAGVVFGKWVRLKQEDSDHKIIWPLLVLIMNTWYWVWGLRSITLLQLLSSLELLWPPRTLWDEHFDLHSCIGILLSKVWAGMLGIVALCGFVQVMNDNFMVSSEV
ncbi:hypothetical protein ACLB2K_076405 [Fragaria x ananassa]